MKAKYMKSLLDFLYELPDIYDDFPNEVLKMIDRYFPFHRLTFIPLNTGFSKTSSLPTRDWINEIYTLGLTKHQLALYYQQGIEYDPFRYAFLSSKYWDKPLITLDEALSENTGTNKLYRAYLKGAGVPYQIVMNLVRDEIRLGVISVYRTEEEGPLQPDELNLLRELSKFIAQHYVIAISDTNLYRVEELFNSVYQGMNFGVFLLDSQFRIIDSNPCASNYAKDLCRKLHPALLPKKDTDLPARLIMEQKVIDSLMRSLKASGEIHQIRTDTDEFHVTMNSFVSSNKSFRGITLNHLVFLFRFILSDERASAKDKVRSSLTHREWEIALLITQGLSNQEIADNAFISLSTVKTHIQHIYDKLGITNRVALIQKMSGRENETS